MSTASADAASRSILQRIGSETRSSGSYVGGSTGTAYTRQCPRDYAVSGFQARATDGLHRLRIVCKHLDISGQLTGADQYLSWVGGNTRGTLQGPYRCASNNPGTQ
jgi:hypothetical protein